MSALLQTLTLVGLIGAVLFAAGTLGMIIASLSRRRRPAGRWHR
jgi:hypothetical protein